MRNIGILYLLLFGILLSASCTKEKEPYVATLSLRFDNREEEVEWMEITSGRQDRLGELYINAWGYNNEHFVINLRNISDTGIITNLTPMEISFSDSAGFHPQQVRGGFIRIIERNRNTLSGVFEIFLADGVAAVRPVRANGSFRILGHD